MRLALGISLSDQQILAHFVKGFFGGYILAPERAALRMLQLVQVAALRDLPSSGRVWSNNEELRGRLPELGAVYFGTPYIADKLV